MTNKPALKLVDPTSGDENSPPMLAVFNALGIPIIVLDEDGIVINANNAAEHFFSKSLSAIILQRISSVITGTKPLERLALHAIEQDTSVTENGIELSNPVQGKTAIVDLTASPLPPLDNQESKISPRYAVIHLHVRTLSHQIERRLGYLDAARSITGMASVLAHEIKNPLSGIRGASQLLEETASEPDRELTLLIRDEVDRICGLVDKMGDFSNDKKITLNSVNIHKVLDRVQQIAENGFAKNITFTAIYDPSLPKVPGDEDQLIQVFLNIVKNAAEAINETENQEGGEITLTTAFRPGVRLALSGEKSPKHLPLMVEIADNGPGISEDIAGHVFAPFITSKPHGSGLGLPLSAKIIADHGGMIDFDREFDEKNKQRLSVFRIMLPIITHENGQIS